MTKNLIKRIAAFTLCLAVFLSAAAFAETASETEEAASQKEYIGGFDLIQNTESVDPEALAAQADTLTHTIVSAVPLST